MELSAFLSSNNYLGSDVIDQLDSAFKRETHPKGHQLINAGSMSKKVYFIEKGLSRSYYVKDEKDITHHFFAENSFAMPIESIFFNNPTPYSHELLENSVIRTINFTEIDKFADHSPQLERQIRYLLINVLKAFSDRMYAIQFQSAKDRYQTMLDKYPDILLRAPLGHVASYLGITQQTLSVIRSQK